VIAGNAKGKTGVIKQVIVEKSRAIVEGANLQTKHVKPSAANPQGGIEKREGSIYDLYVQAFHFLQPLG